MAGLGSLSAKGHHASAKTHIHNCYTRRDCKSLAERCHA